TVVPANPTSADSAFGAFIDFLVTTKKKGKKPGSRTIMASAQADVKPAGKNKDSDKTKFTCNPQPGTCPTTTTTTTTLPGVCGDGTVNPGEACDPAASPTGCAAGSLCQSDCTCLVCASSTGTINFTTGTNVSANCGGVGLQPEAQAPTSGSVKVHNVTANTDSMLALGAGCLYVGGGASTVPGGATPDGATSILDVTHSCPDTNNTLLVGPHTGDKLSCTAAAGPGKSCINSPTSFPLPTCTSDADCGGVAGACIDTPNCFFGPPLPIENGPLSTCVLNTFGNAGGGQIAKNTGEAKLILPLRSHTFVTSDQTITGTPCVQCVDLGMGLKCQGGPNDQMDCTPVGTQGTTLDCPPPGTYLPEFPVSLDPLSTGTVTRSDPGGVFCPGQGLNPGDGAPGFGGTNVLTGVDLTAVATEVTEIGAPAGNISDMAGHSTTLASVFCIPATGNGLIDGAASLPGPGAVSLPGMIQLQ
ncbi:MAG TPA: hypothetical protein VMS22_20915, partial [Candidatus Eisenbacteria bacterium]|nr:hypothetical protein [Candidatus Eisenbacteria bacterium]